MVDRYQLQTHFLIEVNRTVSESDAIAETVPSDGLPRMGIQPDVFSFGLEVESWRFSNGEDRSPLMVTVGQGVIRPVGYGTSLMTGVCKKRMEKPVI